MSMKGRDFGDIAKRHGTLEQRRKRERQRIHAAKLNESMGAFRRDLNVGREMERLDRLFRREG